MTVVDRPTGPPPAARPRHRRGPAAAPYLLIAPAVLLLAAFLVYPVGSVAYYALQHYNPITPYDNGFAGLDNFSRMLFDDPMFWSSLLVAARWVLVEVVLQLLLGLGLALVVNQTFRGRGIARAMVFSPWAVSGVLTTGIFVLLYSPATGIVRVLGDLGIGSGTFAPLAESSTVFGALVIAELWRGVPFFAIMLLADLQSMPAELHEAAAVDGASAWQRFRYVTLPHLRDAIVLATLLRGVWEFNNVDLIYTLTDGGPAGRTTTLPLYVAQQATVAQDFGYGSALTVAAFVILLFCSLVYLRLSKFDREKR